MPDIETKPDPRAEIRRLAKEAAAALASRRDTLKKNIGKSFSDGERKGVVKDFYPDKVLGGKTGDSFLVNFGNPLRSDFIFCEDFLNNFKNKENK